MADADNLDMEKRDPNELNKHVRVVFDEIFGEPEGVKSGDCAWKCSYKCFNKTLSICYLILTYICAVPLSFCWACNFACVAFAHIWQITPCIRDCEIQMVCIQKLFNAVLGAFVVPCCDALGHCFSHIHVENK